MSLREAARDVALGIPGADAVVNRYRHAEQGPVSGLVEEVKLEVVSRLFGLAQLAGRVEDGVDAAFDALWQNLPNVAEDVLHAVAYGLPDAILNHRTWVQAEEALMQERGFEGKAPVVQEWSEPSADSTSGEWLFGIEPGVTRSPLLPEDLIRLIARGRYTWDRLPNMQTMSGFYRSSGLAGGPAKERHQAEEARRIFLRDNVHSGEWDFAVGVLRRILSNLSKDEVEGVLYNYLRFKTTGCDKAVCITTCSEILGKIANGDIQAFIGDGLGEIVEVNDGE